MHLHLNSIGSAFLYDVLRFAFSLRQDKTMTHKIEKKNASMHACVRASVCVFRVRHFLSKCVVKRILFNLFFIIILFLFYNIFLFTLLL